VARRYTPRVAIEINHRTRMAAIVTRYLCRANGGEGLYLLRPYFAMPHGAARISEHQARASAAGETWHGESEMKANGEGIIRKYRGMK